MDKTPTLLPFGLLDPINSPAQIPHRTGGLCHHPLGGETLTASTPTSHPQLPRKRFRFLGCCFFEESSNASTDYYCSCSSSPDTESLVTHSLKKVWEQKEKWGKALGKRTLENKDPFHLFPQPPPPFPLLFVPLQTQQW